VTNSDNVSSPLRVAVFGAGPAGFYVADQLLGRGTPAGVDLYDRLPTPFGLVRQGVAPDHQKIKAVTRAFDTIAARPGFRFFGNVEFGVHLTLDDVLAHYHAVCFATGAQSDRRMGIPGEDLPGSHAATDFVAWYNGHPGYREHAFDLSARSIAIVGVGNVAVDVARILLRTTEVLAATDIADHALDGPGAIGDAERTKRAASLRARQVETVTMIGRRGPAEAAFTMPELRELLALPGIDVVVHENELVTAPGAGPVPASRESAQKLEALRNAAGRPQRGEPRRLVFRFLCSPTEIVAGAGGRVSALRLVRNRLERRGAEIRAVATDTSEILPVDLVFRSVGYRGLPLPGIPFDEARGTIPHERGRVLDAASGKPIPGLYVAGWIKRGPTGVIGTNKPDAVETADAILADFRDGRLPAPSRPDAAAIAERVRERQPGVFTYDDWLRLNALEVDRGGKARPRVKFTSIEEFLAALRPKG